MEFNRFKAKFEKKRVLELPHSVDGSPLVSVCVQTYQHAAYITDCLEGILMQKTDFSFEILLGEDASTDGTREICKAYAKKYPNKIRLFLHHRENNIKIKGKPTGRFNFIYNSFSTNGKYIALCEGDDYWTDPLKLQKQVDFLEANSDYSIHSGNATYKSNNKALNDKNLFKENEERFFLLNDFIRNNNLATCTVLFRSCNLKISEAFFNMVYGDWFLYVMLLKNSGSKAYRSKEIYATYREHMGGIINSISRIEEISFHIHQITTNLKFINSNYSEKDKKLLNQYLFEKFKLYLDRKYFFKALSTLLNSYKIIGINTPLKNYILELRHHI